MLAANVGTLVAARAAGQSIAQAVADLPPCFTAADRLENIDQEQSGPFLTRLKQDSFARAAFSQYAPEQNVDDTDGLRVTFEGGAVIHLRPSGNAPEFRCYVEADSPLAAVALLETHLNLLRDQLI